MKKVLRISGSILFLLATLTIHCCVIIDDDNINAVCNSDCTTLKGKFTTEDGKPIEDVSLELDWSSVAPAGLIVETRKIMTGITDRNGEYKFVFHANDRELTEGSYALEFNMPDNSYITLENYQYFSFGISKRDTIVTGNYHVPKKGARITLIIKNPEAISGDDRVISSASYSFAHDRHVHFTAGQLFSEYGSQATYETAANQYTYIQTSKKVNGQYINILDSLFIPMNEARTYEIEF